MTIAGVVQILLFFLVIAAAAKPAGIYLAKVYAGERTWLTPALGWLERLCYRLAGINPDAGQSWRQYAGSLLAFSLASFTALYALERLEAWLPLNPDGLGAALTPDLAFNTAISFVTNTNWQSYAGETTMSYLVQMAGLTVQNFASAAAGMAVAVAVIRGFARQQSDSLGNFWADLVRGTVHVLLPASVVVALVLCGEGVVQNVAPPAAAVTVEGGAQRIAQGPVASQEAIKMLGTNGGGFFNANSAHPYENPTPVSNFLEMVLIFLIPAGLTYTLGRMVGDARQGWALFAAMSVLFLGAVAVLYSAEAAGNPLLTSLGVGPGGNLEGKETRFGVAGSALFAAITTGASCGAVNAMHDSLTPLGGLVTLFEMQTGEVIFGGVGAGLYGMLLFAILAVFLAGLMVGRTPEYLGKKIEAKEVKMAMVAMLATSAAILLLAAAAAVREGPAGASLNNAGPHGLSELLYAYTSAAANNGSAFAGLNANSPWYNVTLGVAMLAGRFLIMIPLLAAAGSLAAKKRVPATMGTLPTHGPLFVGLLAGTVVILGALTFFPALSLGPIVEHFLLAEGRLW